MTEPVVSSVLRCAASRRGHSKSSVASGAAAMPTRAWMRWGRASAASSMIQPPMLEPTRICGPWVSSSRTAIASPAQRPTVPRRNRRSTGHGRNSRSAHRPAHGFGNIRREKRLGAGHVGAQAGEKDDSGRPARRPVIGDRLAVGARQGSGRSHRGLAAGREDGDDSTMPRPPEDRPSARPPAGGIADRAEPRIGWRRARHGRTGGGADDGRMERLCRLVRRPART